MTCKYIYTNERHDERLPIDPWMIYNLYSYLYSFRAVRCETGCFPEAKKIFFRSFALVRDEDVGGSIVFSVRLNRFCVHTLNCSLVLDAAHTSPLSANKTPSPPY